MTVTTATEKLGVSIMRARLGGALQKHRLERGMTQAELAEFTDLSLKYVGEIERGEANTTLDVIERLAAAVGWNPLDALEGLREPLSEGVRQLLLDEVQTMLVRLRNMSRWLQALDPAFQAKPPRSGDIKLEEPPRRRRVGRPSRKTRQRLQQLQEQERLASQQHAPPQPEEPKPGPQKEPQQPGPQQEPEKEPRKEPQKD